jgi:hypothetical protein
MAKKIDIKAIHENFHTLLHQRNELKIANGDDKSIIEIDIELNRIIVNGIIQGIAFSPQMDDWKPLAESSLNDYHSNPQVDIDGESLTIPDALIIKHEKEKKFKQVQNISMLACTILLLLYYLIVGWWI